MSETISDEKRLAANPYQAPSPESGTNGFAERPMLSVSPVWASLISLSPLAVVFVAAIVFARDALTFYCFSLAFVTLSVDAAAFFARTLWIGPGRLSLRAPTVALVTVAIAFWPAALVHFAGRELESFTSVRFAVQHFVIAALCIGLAGIPFARGSRDRLRTGMRRLPLRYDLAGVTFAATLAALAIGFAVAERQLYSVEKFAEYARAFDPKNYRPLITVVATFLMTMVWRSLFRGTWPWKSWRMLAVTTIAGLWTLSGVALSVAAWLTGGGGLGLAFAGLLVAVPAGRELFLGAAGYRAIDVRAERRRLREQRTSNPGVEA